MSRVGEDMDAVWCLQLQVTEVSGDVQYSQEQTATLEKAGTQQSERWRRGTPNDLGGKQWLRDTRSRDRDLGVNGHNSVMSSALLVLRRAIRNLGWLVIVRDAESPILSLYETTWTKWLVNAASQGVSTVTRPFWKGRGKAAASLCQFRYNISVI